MLLKIAPDVYGPYVTMDKKGIKQLILQTLNALYGTMVAGSLYYLKFSKTLKRNNFTINPYDPCVANRMVNEKQQTICWHVDDCKLSHVDPKVQDKFIQVLRDEYESIFEDGSGKMTVSHILFHLLQFGFIGWLGQIFRVEVIILNCFNLWGFSFFIPVHSWELNIAKELALAVSKHKLLWLVLAK
jgi:hypothetical protein